MNRLFSLTVLLILASFSSFAEDQSTTPSFEPSAPLDSFMHALPGESTMPEWLPGATLFRMSREQFSKDTSMPRTREIFDKWCQAQNARIVQPQRDNCRPLRKGLGCAVGELEYNGSRSPLELGLKDLAKKQDIALRIGWLDASGVVSNNTLKNFLTRTGFDEISIVGGLQRCVRDNRLLSAMVFVSIGESMNLLLMPEDTYRNVMGIGAAIQTADGERQRAENDRKQAEFSDSLKAGDTVRQKVSLLQGMIIEVRIPLVLVQWTSRTTYGPKVTEWVKLDELTR